jgi:glutathione S-transferase
MDLTNKPEWFLALSPTGKVPLLEIESEDARGHVIFESAVIAEYLDEIGEGERLLPSDPLERARERAWVEIGALALADIYRLYTATDETTFEAERKQVLAKLERLEKEIAGPWFSGEKFGLVDAAFGPVFRYLDVFDWRLGRPLIERPPKIRAWSEALAQRPSVRAAVGDDYAERLIDFVVAKHSYLGDQLERHALELA